MPEEKDDKILEPVGTDILKALGGVAVNPIHIGATKPIIEGQKMKAQEAVGPQIEKRRSLQGDIDIYHYTQTAKSKLTADSSEADIKEFEAKYNAEGKYEDVTQHVIQDKKSAAANLKEYEEYLAKNAEAYEEFEDKESKEALALRAEREKAIANREDDQEAEAKKDEAQAAEMASNEKDVLYLTETLKDHDAIVAEYDKTIVKITAREEKIGAVTRAFSDKWGDYEEYIGNIHGDEDDCVVPTATEAHKMTGRYYWGCRIGPIIIEAIKRGDYSVKVPHMYESEIYYATKLGYDVKKIKDRSKKDKKSDLDDTWNWKISWSLILQGNQK
jgi:hypothetical protein